MIKNIKKIQRKRRHQRIRAKIIGTQERPRFCVFKSLNHIYVQIIDDKKGQTIVSASDLEIKKSKADKKIDLARKVGELIGQKAKEKKIKKVVFDRGGFKYHGRLKVLAEEAKKAGLEF